MIFFLQNFYEWIDAAEVTCKFNLFKWRSIMLISIFWHSYDIGHFLQMVYDRATEVGCAFARYSNFYKTGKCV